MNNPLTPLHQKVAIVTGSSKGIGLAMARSFAEQGAHVIISSRKSEHIEQIADELQQEGLSAWPIACHVGRFDQLQNLVNQTIDRFQRIDIVVNNAATNPVFGPLTGVSEELFHKILNTNVVACHNLANLCYPIMKKQGSGSIINISSIEGLKPTPGLGAYSISKAALIMLTKSQAKEWGPDGIRVNAICPGLIQTKFSSAIWQNDQLLESIESQLPLRQMGQPEDLTGLANLLASDAGKFITGSIFTADGGHLLI